jgi:pilus assembly protein CpaB
MRLVFGLVLIVGLALAGFAVYMAKNYVSAYQMALQKERNARSEMIQTTEVYIVNKDVSYGDRLTKDDVVLIQYPEKYLPAGTFDSEEALFPDGKDVLRMVVRNMDANEPLLASKVTEPGGVSGITAQLAKGQRAYAIRVDVASGVSGFLRPGDRVDVYWTGRANTTGDPNSSGEVTKLIETGISLIAVDQMTADSGAGATIARTVTVSATPQQVAALAQAQSSGTLSLSLVGIQDDTVAEAIEVDQNALLGIEIAPEAAPAPRQQICTIRTRRGAEVVELPIPCTN